MIPTTLVTLVTVLSSLAGANAAVFQRQGTFTYLTPQPTLGGGATTSSTTATTPTSSMVSTSPSTTASVSSTQSSRLTSTPSVTSSVPVTPSTTSSVPTTPTTTSSVPVTPPTTSSVPVTPSTTSSIPVIPPTTSSVSVTKPTVPVSTPTSPTASIKPTPTSGTANCDSVQEWQSAFAYTAGARVIFSGQLFTARQWTYNNAPPAHPDQWTPGGICSQPVNNKADCRGISAWESNVAYTTGNRITSQGRLWSAVQWTFANSPGDASGSWQDLGVCA